MAKSSTSFLPRKHLSQEFGGWLAADNTHVDRLFDAARKGEHALRALVAKHMPGLQPRTVMSLLLLHIAVGALLLLLVLVLLLLTRIALQLSYGVAYNLVKRAQEHCSRDYGGSDMLRRICEALQLRRELTPRAQVALSPIPSCSHDICCVARCRNGMPCGMRPRTRKTFTKLVSQNSHWSPPPPQLHSLPVLTICV